MAIGVHSRAMHGTDDPTVSPTRKLAHGGHIETAAAVDKNVPERVTVGTARPRTLRQRTLAHKGEGT